MLVKNNHKKVQVSADEMGHNWPGYLRRIEAGETLIILKEGKPIAEINPSLPSPTSRRPYGLCAGEFTVPDDFDTPLIGC